MPASPLILERSLFAMAANLLDPPEADNSSVAWTPLPGPQTQAYESEAFITGYGGAAGGGKSLLEIGLAVTKHRKSIVFRRHKEDVKDLWSKLRMICGTAGRPNESSKEWRDLPGDRYVRLVGLQHEWDWMKHQGNENDYWAFDEATQFPELAIRTLIAWCRSPDKNQRCRVVLGFNPPTNPAGEWIIEFFAPWLDDAYPNPANPGELRWFARLDDKDVEVADATPFMHKGELVTPLSRTFFPARLSDNPILDATNYRSVLQGMPEPLRSQMLYGDFNIGLTDDEWQVIPASWVRAAQERWTPHPANLDELSAIGVDVAQGGNDRTVLARRHGQWFAPLEVHAGGSTPDADANAKLVELALLDGGVSIIDADGVGASTFFLLVPRVGKQRVIGYRGSERTKHKDKSGRITFLNVRARAWWALREALDPTHGNHIALPPDRSLRAELCAPRFEMQASGLKIEPKDEVKKRTGRSPDLADAVVMAWYSTLVSPVLPRLHRAIPMGLNNGAQPTRQQTMTERVRALTSERPRGAVSSR